MSHRTHPHLKLSVFHGFVTVAPQILELFELIRRVARSNATVLVRGEGGTGKELYTLRMCNG